MGKWGRVHADADREVRRQTSIRDSGKAQGKRPDDRNLQDRGEAITKRADAKEAAKNERGGK